MSRDRNEQLADWLRYTEDPSYDPLPTYATPKETQPRDTYAASGSGVEVAEDDLL